MLLLVKATSDISTSEMTASQARQRWPMRVLTGILPSDRQPPTTTLRALRESKIRSHFPAHISPLETTEEICIRPSTERLERKTCASIIPASLFIGYSKLNGGKSLRTYCGGLRKGARSSATMVTGWKISKTSLGMLYLRVRKEDGQLW